MRKDDLSNLEEQLKNNPNNLGLLLRYAKALLKSDQLIESEQVFHQILKDHPDNVQAKRGLLEVYFLKGNHSTVIVIAEELSQKKQSNENTTIYHIKSLLHQDSFDEARQIYQKLLNQNPFLFDEELMDVFDEDDSFFEEDEAYYGSDYEEGDEDEPYSKQEAHISNSLEDPINEFLYHTSIVRDSEYEFEHVIGLSEVKKMMKHKFSFFITDNNPISAAGRPPRSSMLMYGAPGNGKTLIMKAFVNKFLCPVVPVDVAHLDSTISMSSENYLAKLFSNFNLIKPATIFIENIEYFAQKGSIDDVMTYKTLQAFDSFQTDLWQTGIVASSNKPWLIHTDIFRYGRIEDVVFTPPPNQIERSQFFRTYEYILHNVLFKHEEEILRKTKFFSFAELQQLMDRALYFTKTPSDISITALRKAIGSIDPIFLYWNEEFKTQTKNNKQLKHIFKDGLKFNLDS